MLADDQSQDLDVPRLRGLLDLAGPDLKGELARLLIADLSAVAARLKAKQGDGDLASVRAQSHVLLALSGTIGAMALADAAGRLNALARAGDAAALPGALDEALDRLTDLIPRLEKTLNGLLAAT